MPQKEKPRSVRETAEYNGQLQLLKSQNTELIAKLAERGDGPKKSNDKNDLVSPRSSVLLKTGFRWQRFHSIVFGAQETKRKNGPVPFSGDPLVSARARRLLREEA